MDVTVIALLISGAINLLIIFLGMMVKDKILFAFKVLMDKQKGVMKVNYANDTKKSFTYAVTPNEKGKIKIAGQEYTVDPNSIFYDPQDKIQAVYVTQGEWSTYNPCSKEQKLISPREVGMVTKEAYYAGRKEQLDELKKGGMILLVIAGICVLNVGLTFMVFQSVGALPQVVQGLQQQVSVLSEVIKVMPKQL